MKTIFKMRGTIQLADGGAHNLTVLGSNPSHATNTLKMNLIINIKTIKNELLFE